MLILITIPIIFSCNSKKENRTTDQNHPSTESVIQKVEQIYNDSNKETQIQKTNEEYSEILANFLLNELNDKISIKDNYKDTTLVEEKYGTPEKINIENCKPFSIIGGTVIQLRELHYPGQTQIYYVFDNGIEFYALNIFDPSFSGIKTISFGTKKENIINKFGNDYFEYNDDTISYYINDREIQFYFSNNSLDKINISYIIN